MRFIAPGQFPTREQIEIAMNTKLGYKDGFGFFQPIIRTMAEVAEVIMLRYWREAADTEIRPEPVVEIVRRGTMRKEHYCNHCQYQSVHPRHHFCPNCGIKIKWIDSARVVKKAKVRDMHQHPWGGLKNLK